jgi:hypothetical protein
VPIVSQARLVQRDAATRLIRSRPGSYTAPVFGGMGGGRSGLRMIRLGALVLFLILAATLHGRGSTYNTLHVVYIVIVVGVLVASIAGRGRGRSGLRRPGGGGGGFGSGPPAPNGARQNSDPDADV